MTLMKKLSVWFLGISLVLGGGCSIYYSRANDSAVSTLRQRLLKEDFDDIYASMPDVTRARISRDDFGLRIKAVADRLKNVDPEIKWIRNKSLRGDESIFGEENASVLELASGGKKVFVQIDWASGFSLCGMFIFNDLNDSQGQGFRDCD